MTVAASTPQTASRPKRSGGVWTFVPCRRKDGSVKGYVLMDHDDYERVSHLNWSILNSGYAFRNYRLEDGRQRGVLLHREVVGLEHGDPRECDHRNRDRLDCRKLNLRVTTRGQNAQNLPSYTGSTSEFRGVYWSERKQGWIAEARVNGKKHYLGLHKSERKAADAAARFREQNMPYSEEAMA